MKLKQLEALFYVAQLGSFIAAAARLNTTQPAISARIKEFEQALGVRVFERSGSRTVLTAKGREALHYAERILALSAELQARVGDPLALRGFVRLGVVDTIALTWLPSLMARLGRHYRGIAVELCIDHSVSLRSKLLSHEIDVALLAIDEIDPEVVSLPLGGVPNNILVSPRLAMKEGPLAPDALKDVPIVCHARGTRLHSVMQSWFISQGVEPPLFHECSNVAAVIKLALEGVGVGVLSPIVVERELAEHSLRIVATDPPIVGSSYAAWRLRSEAPPTSTMVANLAAQIARQDGRFALPTFTEPEPELSR